jgi:predicted nuclease of predicted toxin-antitoxin system
VRFLADESCDYAVVTALRAAGHDVSAIIETRPGAEDEHVLAISLSETRVLLTEDKDFGNLAYAGRQKTSGVILIRFPGDARRTVGAAVVDAVARFGDRLLKAFVVIEPGRARLSAPIVP